MTAEYGIYQRVSGPGPEFMCRPLLDDKERLIFSGATAQIAEARANLADAQAKRGDVDVIKKQIEQLAADMAQVRAQIRQRR